MSSSRKRICLQQEDVNPSLWISASSVHNYMLDDPILDYFNLTENIQDHGNIFFKFILDKGIKFEKAIMSYIKNSLKIDYKQISYTREDSYKGDTYAETIKAIKNRVPLIYQGTLHDHKNKIYGTPDIIIRNDYLNKLIPGTIDENSFNSNTYSIIDIKFTSLDIAANGINLLNSGRAKANKGQIILYNRMLHNILTEQNLNTNGCAYCYVLGRGYKMTSRSVTTKSNNCFEKLGLIEPNGRDKEISEKLDGAINWLFHLKENVSEWSRKTDLFSNQLDLLNELRPNMCNTYDAPFHSLKTKIAEEQEEITLLANVSYKNRLTALEHDIYRLTDPELTIDILDLKEGSNRTNLIEKMLLMNKEDNTDIIRPIPHIDKLSKNVKEFFRANAPIEFYIDFETVNIFDSFDRLPNVGHTSYTVMIGLVVNCNSSVYYYNFTADEISDAAECKIFKQMLELVNSLCLENNVEPGTAKFYHWSPIEQFIYKNIAKKSDFISLNFCDALEFFRSEPFLIKGMYNFSLKTVSKSFIEHGLITNLETWSGSLLNGLDASIVLEQYYNKESNINIQDIIEYNKIDCMSILKIVEFIRNNYQ